MEPQQDAVGLSEYNAKIQKLEILESVLHQYQEPQFKIMGNILLEIQRSKMYLLRGCKNLREYVLKHHSFQWRSARRYMNAVRVMNFLAGRHAVVPTSEKQVRCLALCSCEEVHHIWARTVAIAEQQGTPITANLVKTVKTQVSQETVQQSGQNNRAPRPWQDELSGVSFPFDNAKHEQEVAGTGQQCMEGDLSSDTETRVNQEPAIHTINSTNDLKWGRKRSRYHGFNRKDPVKRQAMHVQDTALSSTLPVQGIQAVQAGQGVQPPSTIAFPLPLPLPPPGPLAMLTMPHVQPGGLYSNMLEAAALDLLNISRQGGEPGQAVCSQVPGATLDAEIGSG